MIPKLKDLITEVQLSKLQIFSPGTGGTFSKGQSNMKFDPSKVPTGRLNVYSIYDMGGQCFNKPYGVFWTSSYKQKFKGTAWTDFKKKEFPTWHSGMGAVFEIKGSPKILKIKSHNDYMKIQKKFPMRVECPSGELYLNWRKLSTKYDGFQFAGSKYSVPLLGQWDVESTAWFNMKKLEFVGTTKI